MRSLGKNIGAVNGEAWARNVSQRAAPGPPSSRPAASPCSAVQPPAGGWVFKATPLLGPKIVETRWFVNDVERTESARRCHAVPVVRHRARSDTRRPGRSHRPRAALQQRGRWRGLEHPMTRTALTLTALLLASSAHAAGDYVLLQLRATSAGHALLDAKRIQVPQQAWHQPQPSDGALIDWQLRDSQGRTLSSGTVSDPNSAARTAGARTRPRGGLVACPWKPSMCCACPSTPPPPTCACAPDGPRPAGRRPGSRPAKPASPPPPPRSRSVPGCKRPRHRAETPAGAYRLALTGVTAWH